MENKNTIENAKEFLKNQAKQWGLDDFVIEDEMEKGEELKFFFFTVSYKLYINGVIKKFRRQVIVVFENGSFATDL